MDELKLVKPTKDYIEQIIEYKNEFSLSNDRMYGASRLRNSTSIEQWLDTLNNNSNEETVREGLVPSSTYLAIRISDNKLVGTIDINHKLNDYLTNFGGHIGYSVRESERRKGYAKEMLRLCLDKCQELNIDKALITCDNDNLASAKTIIANGGELENEVFYKKDKALVQRYWINI